MCDLVSPTVVEQAFSFLGSSLSRVLDFRVIALRVVIYKRNPAHSSCVQSTTDVLPFPHRSVFFCYGSHALKRKNEGITMVYSIR